MARTPFYDMHVRLGAKIVDFAGFEMPIQYAGIIEEHLTVRNSVGVFDVTHMGEFEVSGTDALAFIQKMTVNDASKLTTGRVQYSAMCYDDGGIVDDLLVYNMGDYYMLVVNASNMKKDFEWLQKHLQGNVTLRDKSAQTALLAVQGPKSPQVMQKLTSTKIEPIEYYHCVRGNVAGVSAIISRTGYTGERGYEIYFEWNQQAADKIWNALFEAGKEFGIAPIGLGARDTLRLEAGLCLYGNDIDQTTNPLEAGLGWITKIDKGDFVGKAALVSAKQEGLKRRLVGFTLPDKVIARHGYEIKSNGKTIGHVTSGTFAPALQYGIGMGYVDKGFEKEGTNIEIAIRGKEAPAKVVKLPFIKKN